MRLSAFKNNLKVIASDISKHDVATLAASLAYTTALALAPFLLILLTVASLLGQDMQNTIYQQVGIVLGRQAGEAVRIIVEQADNFKMTSSISGLISFLVLAVSASAIFAQLRKALDRVNESPLKKRLGGFKGFLREKFLSVGLVFGFIFLAITSLAVSTLLSVVFEGGQGLIWKTLNLAITAIIFTVLFTAMFRFIPSERFSWYRCMVSGVTATAFFLAGKTLIGLYFGQSAVGSAYGAAGSMIVFLVWVYYMGFTLLLSYEFTNNVLLPPEGHRFR
jgi:membrane protein